MVTQLGEYINTDPFLVYNVIFLNYLRLVKFRNVCCEVYKGNFICCAMGFDNDLLSSCRITIIRAKIIIIL